jgi:hypothetical protein
MRRRPLLLLRQRMRAMEVKLLELILFVMVNAFSCHHDWCVAVDRRSADACVYVAVEVWRYQRPETTIIDVDIEGPSCR